MIATFPPGFTRRHNLLLKGEPIQALTLCLVSAQVKQLFGKVHADHRPGGTDNLGGGQCRSPGAATNVENPVAGTDPCHLDGAGAEVKNLPDPLVRLAR